MANRDWSLPRIKTPAAKAYQERVAMRKEEKSNATKRMWNESMCYEMKDLLRRIVNAEKREVGEYGGIDERRAWTASHYMIKGMIEDVIMEGECPVKSDYQYGSYEF